MRQALIAGRGQLPAAVAVEMSEPLICTLAGNAPDRLTPDITFRLEQLGTFLSDLKAQQVDEVCFCGAVRRPEVDITQIDAATRPLLPALQRALMPGDDGALRAIIGVFEDHGFTVRGAHEIAPALLPASGVIGRHPVSGPVAQELARAADVFAEMARLDEGQACVLRGQEVLAREDSRGTDAMLADLAAPSEAELPPAEDPFFGLMDGVGSALGEVADWLSGPAAERGTLKGSGGLFVKGPKPGQDRRADLPTIGPETVRAAARAGLRGLALASGGVMVLNLPEVRRLADEAGLFLLIGEPD